MSRMSDSVSRTYDLVSLTYNIKHNIFFQLAAIRFRSNRHLILKTLSLDSVNMAGSDTYLESVVVMNRIKFMLYFNYSFESQFTLVHVLCQCCLYSTLRFSVENTIIAILILQSVYSLF